MIHVFYPSTQEGVDLHEIELNLVLVHIVSPRTKLYSKNLLKKKKKRRGGGRKEGRKEIKEWSEQGRAWRHTS